MPQPDRPMKTLTATILTADACLYDGPAAAAFLPGLVSPFEVLPGHAPLISVLEPGAVRLVLDGKDAFSVRIRSGVARVSGDKVTVCVEI